jgi:hypothetical protein
VLGHIGHPQRVWVFDEQAEQALAVRQVPDPGDHTGFHAGMDEPDQAAVLDHAERGVPGIDQFPGSVDDMAQHRVQGIGAAHGEERREQAS